MKPPPFNLAEARRSSRKQPKKTMLSRERKIIMTTRHKMITEHENRADGGPR